MRRSWRSEGFLKNLPWRSGKKKSWIQWIYVNECSELAERIRMSGGSFYSNGRVYAIRKAREGVERFIVRFPARQKKSTEKKAV